MAHVDVKRKSRKNSQSRKALNCKIKLPTVSANNSLERIGDKSKLNQQSCDYYNMNDSIKENASLECLVKKNHIDSTFKTPNSNFKNQSKFNMSIKNKFLSKKKLSNRVDTEELKEEKDYCGTYIKHALYNKPKITRGQALISEK